ncbi:MAG: glycyl-radical enzyme activating protein [Bacteroidales bacterium]|jgi:pyruvate formate lyase activating enzyme|nr:glycyl-radical enzyme activating protein [Bacteroidales bacterium]
MFERTIEITAIQRLCLYDGPGVRTTVFLRGCYLDCPWCCNPETKSNGIQYYYYPEKCWYDKKDNNNIPAICNGCKKIHILECPYGVYESISIMLDADALFERIIRDRDFWGKVGGVTFSGGEPLMQSEALCPLVKRLKENGVHITMETSLYAPNDKLLKIEPYIDMFIVDVKMLNKPFVLKHYKDEKLDFTTNIHQLSDKGKIGILRMVLIDKLTVTPENIIQLEQLTEKIKFGNLEFLEYHALGNKKAERMGLTSVQFEKPNEITMKSVTEKFVNCKNLKT